MFLEFVKRLSVVGDPRLSAFVGTWAMHDGVIDINASGSGQMAWPGIAGGQGDLQSAKIKVKPLSSTLATVNLTSGTLVWHDSYGPGSTFTISTTSLGLNLMQNGSHIWFFCTESERESGKDQQYCGA